MGIRKNIFLLILTGTFFLLCQCAYSIDYKEETGSLKEDLFIYTIDINAGTIAHNNNFQRQMSFLTNGEFDDLMTFSFNMLKQTTKPDPYNQLFNYPRYGLGIKVGNFFEDVYESWPVMIYGLFESTIIQRSIFKLDYNVSFGLTDNWKKYDPSKGNFNTSFGSSRTCYSQFMIYMDCMINRFFNIGLGYGLTHFSNGAIKLPNVMGLNTVSPHLRLSYVPNRFKKPETRTEIPEYLKNTYLDISTYGGVRSVTYPECDIDTTTNFNVLPFPVFGVTAVLNRQISYLSTLGIGVTLGYDAARNAFVHPENGLPVADLGLNTDNVIISVFPSYEIEYKPVSFFLQPCFYLLKKETTYKKPTFYGRFGLKCNIWNNMYAGISLHTFKLHADYIEWALGYRIK